MAAERSRIGNWTPDGTAERDRLRRDYLELQPAQRVKQVSELSRFMSRVAEAGRRERDAASGG
jgi:hypothetical protein